MDTLRTQRTVNHDRADLVNLASPTQSPSVSWAAGSKKIEILRMVGCQSGVLFTSTRRDNSFLLRHRSLKLRLLKDSAQIMILRHPKPTKVDITIRFSEGQKASQGSPQSLERTGSMSCTIHRKSSARTTNRITKTLPVPAISTCRISRL